MLNSHQLSGWWLTQPALARSARATKCGGIAVNAMIRFYVLTPPKKDV